MAAVNGTRRPSKKSTADVIAAGIGRLIGEVLKDLSAAWALMAGLDMFHVDAPYWGCFLIIVAVGSVLNSAIGLGSKQ